MLPGGQPEMDNQDFDYYYGDESNQFSFYRIPRQLVTGERFKQLSTDAKLLYGLLLGRMGLSAKNGWYDGAGRVYIYYTLEEIQNDLRCAHGKAVKLLAELDKGKGFSLIERVKQGQGRPTKIYVKRFTTRNVPPPPPQPEPESDPEPRPPIFGIADFRKSDGSYIKSNQTESIYTDLSIHPSPSTQNRGLIDRYDRYDCREEIESQIDFLGLCRQYAQEDVDGIIELMVDTLCSVHPSIRIGGEPIPINQVRSRFLSLERKHIEYVFDSLKRNTTKVRNIRAYLLTALYNAPITINQYYQAEVQHDFGA